METQNIIQRNTEEQAAVFTALADPTRLRLIKLLCRQRAPHALCVNALAAFLNFTQSAVSQHLRVLQAIGLVNGERRGYHVHYFINREALERCWNLTSAALIVETPGKEEKCEKYCPVREKRRR